MSSPAIKPRKSVDPGRVERISLSLASEDKDALEKIADEKKVSIAWVIRDAIAKYLFEETKKVGRVTL